jgi:hypothetical protein
MFNSEKMLSQLNKVPYATLYNFQPWTVNKTANLLTSLQWPDKILKQLRRSKALTRVPVYPYGEESRHLRHNTFYTAHQIASSNLTQSRIYNGQISFDMLRHQFALIDVLLAFINLYPAYNVEIDWNRSFPYAGRLDKKGGGFRSVKGNYNPDAVVKLTSFETGREYHYIVELERTKTHEQIRDKFLLCNLLSKFGSYGLSRHTKFLFVIT